MSMDDDDYLWFDNTSARLRGLPFEMADRMTDEQRAHFGKFAGVGEWDWVVQAAAGDAVLHGLPLTPEEKDLLVRGLRWVGEPHDLSEARVIDPWSGPSWPPGGASRRPRRRGTGWRGS